MKCKHCGKWGDLQLVCGETRFCIFCKKVLFVTFDSWFLCAVKLKAFTDLSDRLARDPIQPKERRKFSR